MRPAGWLAPLVPMLQNTERRALLYDLPRRAVVGTAGMKLLCVLAKKQ